jgi:tetratricopeptide (TPR) repeat protein
MTVDSRRQLERVFMNCWPSHNAFIVALERRNVRHLTKAVMLVAIIAATKGVVRAEEWNGCGDPDLERRISSCTKLIETPGIDPARLAGAFDRRGSAYIGLGQYQRALRDYDEAIRISPQDAVALNNRALVYLRLGKPSQGLLDVEKAVQFAPREPHFYSMRALIVQSLGDRQGAIRDYNTAMALGGTRWIKFYQCGLRLAQLYHGSIDGILRSELGAALRACVDKGSTCDPVEADPQCPDPVG